MITVAAIKCKACRDAGHCVRTGECCHIRENVTIKDEAKIKQQVYANSGVLYLYPLSRYTISLNHQESQYMREEAKRRGIKISILPKKVIYDPVDDIAIVYDWFVDHEVCPFLEGKNHCSIYDKRPNICQDFPFHHLKNSQLEEIKSFITEQQITITHEPYEELVQKASESLTQQGIEV